MLLATKCYILSKATHKFSHCQTTQQFSVLESYGTLNALTLQNQAPVESENNSVWAGEEMTQNEELIPSSPSSNLCEIWIRSQMRLYSAPSPTGMSRLKLKESRNISSWEVRLSWVEFSNPSLKAWQLVPDHNWTQAWSDICFSSKCLALQRITAD